MPSSPKWNAVDFNVINDIRAFATFTYVIWDGWERFPKSEFPSRNYNLEVDMNAIYNLETSNYENSNMT